MFGALELFNFNKIIFETIIDPRTVASKILSLKLNDQTVVQAGLFVSICSTILTYLFLTILSGKISQGQLNTNPVLQELFTYITSIQPIFFAANQILQMLLFSVLITFGGKLFNGYGKFFDAFICVIWVEFILLILKLIQIIVLPFSVLLAFGILVPGVIWSLWAFASMAAVVHGFKSTTLTFLGGLGLSVLVLTLLNILY
tara:strand:- start:4 stop:606 length:603 start_codon:yes stop_codon:yes gene_type:complete